MNISYNYVISKLFFLFLVILIGFSPNLFANNSIKIQNIIISNSKDLSQVKNGELHLTWTYSKSLNNAKLNFTISKQKSNGDSLVWISDEKVLSNPEYIIICPWIFQNGMKYVLHINGSTTNNDIIEKSGIEFVLNTPPEKLEVITKNGEVFSNDKIEFKISESSDNQIDTKDLKYNINIFSESNRTQPVVDTLIALSEKNEVKLLIMPNDLDENDKFFAYFRAWDGVEYSAWSSQIYFFVNRYDEPPYSFELLGENDLIIKGSPVLEWNLTSDPEEKIGGKIINYTLLISPEKRFQNITEKIIVQPEVNSYQTKKLENHRKYYWKVFAMDSDSLITPSIQINSITPDYGNEPPPKPGLLQPTSGELMKPEDYFSWRQPSDKDRWDKLSYTVYIMDIEKNILLKEEIPDSLIELTKYNTIKGLTVFYDNTIKFQLNNFDINSKLSDTKKYYFQVVTRDNWGGGVFSNWLNSNFIYDDNINSIPDPPISGFYPDSAIIYTTFPMLKWNAGNDSDVGDELKYEIRISRATDFNNTRYINQVTDYNELEYEIKRSLIENEKYYWKVRSIDLEESKSKWSDQQIFWINSINETPIGPVQLLYPETLTEFNNESSFWWFSTFDPDPGDRIDYVLELATDKLFKNKVYNYKVKSSSLSAVWREAYPPPPGAIGVHIRECSDYSQLVDNRMYYWRVLAVDQRGFSSITPVKTPRIAFNIKNDAPDIPRDLKPGGGVIVTDKKMRILWQHSVDPDFSDLSSTLKYQVLLSQNVNFPDQESNNFISESGNNYIKISDNLIENCMYYYKVKSIDQHNLSSLWSPLDSFITNFIKEPPLKISESIVPRDSMIVKTRNPVISWQETTDPDPEQKTGIKYHVKYVPLKYHGTNNENKFTKEIISEIDVNFIQLQSLAENVYYCFKIAAKDKEGILSEWSNSQVFAVNVVDNPPSGFNLVYPHFNGDSISIDSKIVWSSSYDPDPGDKVCYTLYYSEDSLLKNNVEKISIYETYFDSIYYQPLPMLKRATKYFWKVVAEDISGNQIWGSNSNNNIFKFHTVGYKRQQLSLPQKFLLYDNQPNPFMTITKIQYEVSEYSDVKIAIYNILGEEVSRLASGKHLAGKYTIEWDGTDSDRRMVPGGMYLCRMTAKGFITHKKIVLLR